MQVMLVLLAEVRGDWGQRGSFFCVVVFQSVHHILYIVILVIRLEKYNILFCVTILESGNYSHNRI